VPQEAFLLAALAELLREERAARQSARSDEDPYSPWHRRDGWRLNSSARRVLKFRLGEAEKAIDIGYARNAYELTLEGVATLARGELVPNSGLRAELGGRRLNASVVVAGERRYVFLDGRTYALARVDPLYSGGTGSGEDGGLVAPMPGKVIALLAEPGSTVDKGVPLLILEAMKMEHTITAPAGGRLRAFRYAVGDQVKEGAELVEFEAEKENEPLSPRERG
jgi:3-methylcrotonyl-CoA carboxylase alpha subunit